MAAPPDCMGVLDPIRFGNFELDPRSYQLRRADRVLKLARIPTEILLLLVEKNGELVTREEIIERVWGADVFLDTDNSINGAIRRIRHVLRDDSGQPRFVQTVTGKGYRFIAPLVPPEAESVAVAAPAASVVEAVVIQAPTRKPAWWRWPIIVGIALGLIAGTGVWFQSSRPAVRPQASSGTGGRSMLAVLPFENLTGDAGQEYFSDGLTEEMITQLGNLDPAHLGIIARTSVMHYKNSHEPLDRIGKELGIQYVLEGSVRRDASRVRITAQLIQVKDQSHIWARQYDRDLSSLLALQGEIAQQIASEIQLTLGENKRIDPAHQPPLTPEAYEAYDLYLRGRYFWNKRTIEGFEQAISCFEQAVAKDANYARAYAGLADSYALIGGYSLTSQSESMPKARAVALKALELDPGLAEAHTSLALITENYDWDWPTAEKEYRRAIELNPNYLTAHHWYAEYLSLQGRFDEALAESERARQLDPLSLIVATDNGMILHYARQYDRAIAQFLAVQEMEPNFNRAHMVMASYVEKGRFAEALADLEKYGRRSSATSILEWQAYIYGRAGQPVQARHALARLQQIYRDQHVNYPDAMLWAYIGVGDRDAAFVWFEKAYADHSNLLTSLKVNPAYDPLRGDPRFQDLLRRVRLAQ